jgi:hypothetical protein
MSIPMSTLLPNYISLWDNDLQGRSGGNAKRWARELIPSPTNGFAEPPASVQTMPPESCAALPTPCPLALLRGVFLFHFEILSKLPNSYGLDNLPSLFAYILQSKNMAAIYVNDGLGSRSGSGNYSDYLTSLYDASGISIPWGTLRDCLAGRLIRNWTIAGGVPFLP